MSEHEEDVDPDSLLPNRLKEAARGDRRTQLEGIRDYITTQLDGYVCSKCLTSRLRTGDQASLILRLQTVLDELDTLPVPGSEEVNRLAAVRNIHGLDRGSAATSQSPPDEARDRRTGSRRPGGGRRAQA